MPTRRAYLDWNASAPLRPQARRAMLEAFDLCGNPSSVHGEGRAARRLIERARCEVASLVGAEPRGVVFTSGGTEANMLALSPGLRREAERRGCEVLLVSAIEHPSVRNGGRFAAGQLETLPVDPRGVVDLSALAQRLRKCESRSTRPLVSVMFANNETGAVQPIAQIAELVHAAGGFLHVDAVQGPGLLACAIGSLGADLMTLSGHKLGGPKGVGALLCRDQAILPVPPLLTGGGQERGFRAGTENLAGIAGFGAAACAARADLACAAKIRDLRDRFERALQAISPEAVVFCAATERLPNTTLFAVPGIKAETAVIALDLSGVAVSSGAACSSGKVQPSHVLAAMGVESRLARGALRVSIGRETSESELDCFLDAWKKFTGTLHKGMGGLAA